MAAPVRPGDVLAGKYRVERVLGQGGMGVVVQATHLQLGQPVALKFLLPGVFDAPQAAERFQREARAAVQFRGEHVARVMDVGTLESGAPYMVMEYLEGADLSATLQRRGALPIPEAVDYVLQACEALAEAHALGIVHRDLKPANLFLTHSPDGSALVKVLDFGISKALGASGANDVRITSTAAVIGSPLYMSPEQITSARDVDHRTDIWALGVILHELIAGSPPFTAESASALLVTIAVAPPIRLRSVRPEIPVELEAVVDQCLAKDRTQRFTNVAELAWSLRPFSSESGRVSVDRVARVLGVSQRLSQPPPSAKPVESVAPVEPAPLPIAPADPTLSAWGKTESAAKRRRVGMWTLAAAVVACAIAAGVVLWKLRAPEVEEALAPATTLNEPSTAVSVGAPAVLDRPATDPVVAPAPPTVAPAIATAEATADKPPPVTHTRRAPATAPKRTAPAKARPKAVAPAASASVRPRATAPATNGRDVFDDVE